MIQEFMCKTKSLKIILKAFYHILKIEPYKIYLLFDQVLPVEDLNSDTVDKEQEHEKQKKITK